jgi:DNA-binding transcriptional regulator YhcF (GntR family)
MALRISVDRTLPVPIGVQVKGQIEYGIASGALKPGTRLPSVRELAAAEGIAHVTVSHVYRALQRDGLIVVRPGQGTYVAGTHGAHPNKSKAELHRLVDAMVTRALKSGYRPAEISHMVTARLASGQAHRPLIALVGLFSHATEVYAREAAALLADLAPEIVPSTIGGRRASAAQLERAPLRRGDDQRQPSQGGAEPPWIRRIPLPRVLPGYGRMPTDTGGARKQEQQTVRQQETTRRGDRPCRKAFRFDCGEMLYDPHSSAPLLTPRCGHRRARAPGAGRHGARHARPRPGHRPSRKHEGERPHHWVVR